MFVENRLAGGDFVSPIPLGLVLTLQYSDTGVLHKVFIGVDRSQDVTSDLLRVFVEHETVPNRISIKNGTTWISGVLYSEDIIPKLRSQGKLPGICAEEYISTFIKVPETFKFYAGRVSSLAVKFKGNLIARNWLKMAGFGVLPGYIIPSNITGSKFKELITTNTSYPAEYPLIPELFVHRLGQDLHFSCELYQDKIVDVKLYAQDSTGELRATICLSQGKEIDCEIRQVARFDLHVKDLIVYDNEANRILYNYRTGSEICTGTSNKYTCPMCKKLLLVDLSSSGPIYCSDPRCVSRLYPRICHMLGTFNLPIVTRQRYAEYTKKSSRSDLGLFSVFNMPEYESVELSDIRLVDALRAVIPTVILPKKNSIEFFISKCNNSIETVEYYVTHPDKIWEDLGVDKHIFRKFYYWLQEDTNVEDIVQAFHNPHIHILIRDSEELDMSCTGIFICLTGEFYSGDISYIQKVLESYGANVSTEYSSEIDIVVVGDLMTNVSGQILHQARKDNKVIYTESEFLRRYQIRLEEKIKP